MPEVKFTAVVLEDMLFTWHCFKSLHLAQWHSDNSVRQLNGLLVMESTLQSISDAGAELCLPSSENSLCYRLITQ